MHIDLQELYYFDGEDCPTAQAYTVANSFAQSLRHLDIPNFWVACDTQEKPEILPYEHILREKTDLLHQEIELLPNELIIKKAPTSAFGNKHLSSFLNHSNNTTLLVTGVYFDSCYQESIKNALQAGFNVYACLDATNCPQNEHDEFLSTFFDDLTTEQKSKLHVTTTTNVIQTLSPVIRPQHYANSMVQTL
jgi:nicotinamidase-related amidase